MLSWYWEISNWIWNSILMEWYTQKWKARRSDKETKESDAYWQSLSLFLLHHCAPAGMSTFNLSHVQAEPSLRRNLWLRSSRFCLCLLQLNQVEKHLISCRTRSFFRALSLLQKATCCFSVQFILHFQHYCHAASRCWVVLWMLLSWHCS